MNNLNYKHHVVALDPDEFRSFVDGHHPEDYQLIDVRQYHEFIKSHLPGALSLPADDLPRQLDSLDREKISLLYCSQGALSMAAAAVLSRAGFEQVFYLYGGLNSSRLGMASGSTEDVCLTLLGLGCAADQARMAWQIEDAARLFYLEISKTIEDSDVSALFAELAAAESQHKETLKALWEALMGEPAADDFPGGGAASEKVMEGGLSLDEALTWASEKPVEMIIDYAMAMELNAYDQYLYLQRNSADPDSQRLFEVMADEERHHLKILGALL